MIRSNDEAAYATWVGLRGWLGAGAAPQGFEQTYLGHFDSVASYIQLFVDEMGYLQQATAAVPESIRPYLQIDVDGLASDVVRFGSILAVPALPSGVWIFQASQ
jgi:hypothetical protein